MISFGFGRKKRTVGLDLGSGLLKVAVVDHSGDEPRLESVAYRTAPPGAMSDGEVTEPDVLGESLEDLFRESEIEKRGVAVALEGRDVIIKGIEMDRMSEEDAREVIRWEAEQHVPFDMDNVQLDFVITDPEGEGLEMNVLLVAAKRDMVDQRVGWLNDQGLKPRVVDVGAFALHNALEYNHPDALTGISALVSIGHSRTVVNIMDDGVPVMSRELSAGTARIRRRLQREFQVEPAQAEAAVRGEEQAPGVDEVVSEVAQEIARGVERSALFLESQEDFGGEYQIQLGRIWVCGGGVGVPGLLEALARRLDVETHVTNPLARLSSRSGVLGGGGGTDLPPATLMQAVGLALREAD